MQQQRFCIALLIQRQMKTEKLNIHNSIISMKTSITEVYCNVTINNISRLATAGFFMAIPVSVTVLQIYA